MLHVVATLDGQRVRGLFDGDDAISVSPGADVGTGLVGADSCALFSQSADRSAAIAIKLQHTSPTHRQLSQILARQRAGRMIPVKFSWNDTNSNEGGVADQCYIQAAPTDSKGTNATVREWTLWTGDYKPNIPNG